MKVNLKTTNDENAAATLVCHQKGPRTVNGIIGNTRRGIRVDQTLDPDSNNPVANKPVSTALAALAGKIDAALQKPTGLTKTKLVGVGASGQENIEIGENLTLTNGKLAAGGSVSPTLNLIDLNTEEIRTTITEEEYNNLKNGLYNSVNYYTETPEETYLQSKILSAYNDSDKSLYCAFSSIKITATSETDISLTNIIYELNVGQKDTSGNYPITIQKMIEIPFGSGSGSGSSGGLTKIQCTRKDYQDLTKGGTVDTSTLPTDVPFILEVGMDGENSAGITYYGKLEFLMSYYSYNDHSGESKKTWFGYANDSSNYYTAYIRDGEDVIFSQYINTNAKIVDIELPTKNKPVTATTSFTITDLLSGVLSIRNHYDIYLFGSLFNKYRSPVYSDTNGTLYYYIIDYDLDNIDTLAMQYTEIPTSTSTITFED